MKTKLNCTLICAFIIAVSACSSKLNTSSRRETIKVPIAINILTNKDSDLTGLNTDLYRLKIKDHLDHFGGFELVLVEEAGNADVILEIDVKNFLIFQREESSSSSTYKRSIQQVGTDASGKPIYQMEPARGYSESVRIPVKAKLSAKFTFRDPSYKVPPQNYFPQYTWRASSKLPGGEPSAEDFLFMISGKMLSRVTYDLRKYYEKLNRERSGPTYLSAK